MEPHTPYKRLVFRPNSNNNDADDPEKESPPESTIHTPVAGDRFRDRAAN